MVIKNIVRVSFSGNWSVLQ